MFFQIVQSAYSAEATKGNNMVITKNAAMTPAMILFVFGLLKFIIFPPRVRFYLIFLTSLELNSSFKMFQ